jgi:translation initiation factor 3 subunit B
MVSVKDNKNEDEPSFSDDEDYIDQITNEELLPELMATEPRKDESIDKIIVIDNIPKVGQDKKEKLKQIINKLLQSYGTIVNQYFPEDNGVTIGLVFLSLSLNYQKK